MRKNTKSDSRDSPRSLKSRARIIAVKSTVLGVHDSKSHIFLFFNAQLCPLLNAGAVVH